MEFTPHRAVDAAYATMKVAQALCAKEGLSLAEILKKYAISLGRIENYEVTQSDSKAFAAFRAAREKAKEERDKARAHFHIFADRAKRRRAKEGKLQNKTVCFSHALELQTERAKTLLLSALDQAARITFRAEECDIYVCLEGEGGNRLRSVQTRGARVLTPDEFKAYLGG